MASWQGGKCKMTLLHPKPVRRDTGPHYPSLSEYQPALPQTMRPRYEGEMALREQRAQEEIARKRTQVAPLYNKGGYQYVSEGIDPTTVGRKI